MADTNDPVAPAAEPAARPAPAKRTFAKSFLPPPPPVIDAPPALPAHEEGIAEAVRILREGGLVAFPTETVYGLGADAANSVALHKIFKVKGRPKSHPLIVHIASAADLAHWAHPVPEAAERLAEAFWPGPLTLVLNRCQGVLDEVTGGQDTIALRVPSHPAALALLEAFGGGIAGPSANRFGKISPTSADHVRADLGRDVDLVLDGGACEVGIESTIVDLSREQPVLLRPGRIKAEDIERVLDAKLASPDGEAPRAPGSHASHYAPKAAMKIVKRLEFTDELAQHKGRRIGVIALEISVPRVAQALQCVLPASSQLYAQAIYAKLRELDDLHCDLILCEAPPKGPQWDAVWDRLARAQHAHAHGVRTRAPKPAEPPPATIADQRSDDGAPPAG